MLRWESWKMAHTHCRDLLINYSIFHLCTVLYVNGTTDFDPASGRLALGSLLHRFSDFQSVPGAAATQENALQAAPLFVVQILRPLRPAEQRRFAGSTERSFQTVCHSSPTRLMSYIHIT